MRKIPIWGVKMATSKLHRYLSSCFYWVAKTPSRLMPAPQYERRSTCMHSLARELGRVILNSPHDKVSLSMEVHSSYSSSLLVDVFQSPSLRFA